MASRMIVMNGGVAEQIGTPLEVYQEPRTLFAAQFIGSPAMNILDARVSGGKVLVGDLPVANAPGPDGPVKLGVRPEHLVVDPDGPLRQRVQLTEPLGANTLFHGKLDGIGSSFTASLQGVHPSSDAESVMQLAIQPDQAHIFDSETGLRRTS